MNYYRLYGTRIDSLAALELPPASPSAGEKGVILDSRPEFFADLPETFTATRDWFHGEKLGDYLVMQWTGIGRFAVRNDGREIIYTLDGRTPWSVVQAYLLNQVLSTALIRQGLESLHGVACEVQGRAYLFLGNTRMGKSTLLNQLVGHGANFVSDDLLVLSRREDGICVHRGLPRFKLYPDVMSHFPLNFERTEPLSPYTDKTLCVLPPSRLTALEEVPVEKIFVLKRGRKLAARELHGTEKFSGLVSNVFNTMDFENRRRSMSLGAIAQWNPASVVELTYPHSFDALPGIADRLLMDFL